MMKTIDMRKEKDLVGLPHFSMNINGKKIAYCYIRKNACSAYKNFFCSESSFNLLPNEDRLRFMVRCHMASKQDLYSADNTILILRDPLSRIASFFNNKLIQKDRAAGSIKLFTEKTSCHPDKTTFKEFVVNYLTKDIKEISDLHLRSQKSHLLPIKYDCAFLISELHLQMKNLLGDGLAEKYFLKKTNSSMGPLSYDENVSNVLASDLQSEFLKHKKLPSENDLYTDELRAIIHDIYADDYNLLSPFYNN